MSSSAALALLLSAAVLQPYEAVEPHMGTLFSIKLYAANEQQAKQAFQAAFARIAELDATLSDYKPDSELSRVTTVTTPTPISTDLFTVLAEGQSLSKQTDGAFDVTVGPLTHLWRQNRRTHSLPQADILQDALSRSGFQKMHLDPTTHTVRFDTPVSYTHLVPLSPQVGHSFTHSLHNQRWVPLVIPSLKLLIPTFLRDSQRNYVFRVHQTHRTGLLKSLITPSKNCVHRFCRIAPPMHLRTQHIPQLRRSIQRGRDTPPVLSLIHI